jgi:two-component system NtrC family response regulator
MPLFEKDAIEALINYDWPGNVRQLENVLERVLLLDTNEVITRGELPSQIAKAKSPPEPSQPCEIPFDKTLAELEEWYVRITLDRFDGNRSQAAKFLDISRRTLQRKLKEWGIQDK